MKTISKNLLIAALLFCTAGTALAEPVEVREILKTTKSWNDAVLPGFSSGQTELRVLKFKIAPGAKTAIHTHPTNAGGYILAGELTMYTTSDTHGSFADPKQVKETKLVTGNAWSETVNTWHYGENKTDKDVEFVVVFAGAEGTPPTLTLGTFVK